MSSLHIPKIEYPGKWLVYYPSTIIVDGGHQIEIEHCNSLAAAIQFAKRRMQEYEIALKEFNPGNFRIYWKCSDNDPRIGKTHFTPFYQVGRFNPFGDYIPAK